MQGVRNHQASEASEFLPLKFKCGPLFWSVRVFYIRQCMSYLVCYCPTIYTHFPCYRAISSAFLVPVLTVFIHRWRYVHQFWGRTDGFRLYSHMQTRFGTLLKSHKHIAYACVICYWWLTFCTTFSCHCHMLCELQVFHVNRRKCTWKVIQVMDTMVLSHIRDFKSWFVGKIFEKRPNSSLKPRML